MCPGPCGFWEVHTALDGPRINQSNRGFLSCYTINTIHSLIRLGLKIEKEAQTCIKSQNFKRRWKEILNTAASNLYKALVEGYKEEMELLDKESAAVRETMKKALTDEDLAEYDSISKEALERKETEIRKSKEKKLERDRILARKEAAAQQSGKKRTFAEAFTARIKSVVNNEETPAESNKGIPKKLAVVGQEKPTATPALGEQKRMQMPREKYR